MQQDLKIIKKYYGERMSHLCRELFPSILENDGKLSKLMLSNFYPTKSLYDDIIEDDLKYSFKDYIYSRYNNKIDLETSDKNPEELLNIAGYNLYECHNEAEIQKFKKYYAKDEELCTFNGGRLRNCYVFFAVKKNIYNIRRENFKEPDREDDYGRSVISIQFTKGNNNTLSIKNRYNHTVNKPDSTYGNNLENIIPGLTKSFEKYYHLNVNNIGSKELELNNYIQDEYKMFYRFNFEKDNIYYCNNNVIIDNFKTKKYPKEKYIIFDNFILDLVNKKISTYNNTKDSFVDSLKNIEKIEIKKEKDKKKIIINNNIELVLNKFNELISYKNENIEKIGDDFLRDNLSLEELILPNVKEVGINFLYNNKKMKELSLEKIEKIGSYFLYHNKELSIITLPNVKKIRSCFFVENEELREISFPNLEEAGFNFLYQNSSIRNISLPKLKKAEFNFFYHNYFYSKIDFPSLEEIGKNFFYEKLYVESINLPNAQVIEDNFLCKSYRCDSINMPKVKVIGNNFLRNNFYIKEIDLPKVVQIGNCFLKENKEIKTINFPNAMRIGDAFLQENEVIRSIQLDKVVDIGHSFLYSASKIKKIILPEVEVIGNEFIMRNRRIDTLIAPKLKEVGPWFLESNRQISKIDLPYLTVIDSYFMENNKLINYINLPSLKRVDYPILSKVTNVEYVNIPKIPELENRFKINKTLIKKQ